MRMVVRRSSTSKKRVTVGIVVVIVIVALAGIVLWVSHTPRPSQDIALAVAKAVYSNNARAFQGLWPNNPHKAGFVYQVSQWVQQYGPVKEVVLMSSDRELPGLDGKGEFGGPAPGVSSWKVVAERGNYMIAIKVEDGKLVGCNFNLPGGIAIGTGSI